VAAQVLMNQGDTSVEAVRAAVDAETLRADEDGPADALRRGVEVEAPSLLARVLWHAWFAALVSFPMALIVPLMYWGLMGEAALVASGTIVAVCVAGGALFGLVRGLAAPAGEAWDGGTLALKRRELEDAITAKFGQLDDARREDIQSYDQRRIIEMSRRLSDARRLEDLGA
jgi:hypothetical protein